MIQIKAITSRFVLTAALFLGVIQESAAAPSPAGRWLTVDETTGQVRSIVRLEFKNQELEGTIEKLFLRPGESDRCEECPGPAKNQPITGMKFLWGLKADGEEYSGGEIFDPDNGKTYRCRLKVSPDGRTLAVRGFLGISLLGRTQTWRRAP